MAFGDDVKSFFSSVGSSISGAARTVGNGIVSGYHEIAPTVSSGISTVYGDAKNFAGGLVTNAQNLENRGLDIIGNTANNFSSGAHDLLSGVGGSIGMIAVAAVGIGAIYLLSNSGSKRQAYRETDYPLSKRSRYSYGAQY